MFPLITAAQAASVVGISQTLPPQAVLVGLTDEVVEEVVVDILNCRVFVKMDLRDENSLRTGEEEKEKKKNIRVRWVSISQTWSTFFECDWCAISLGPRFFCFFCFYT